MFKFLNHNEPEGAKFRPGQRVELKTNPGVADIIANYDPMMVPPITLVNDPHLRYPEELELVNHSLKSSSWSLKGKQSSITSNGQYKAKV